MRAVPTSRDALRSNRTAQPLSVLSADQVWSDALSHFENVLPRETFDTWLLNTEAIRFEEDLLEIGVPSKYIQDWLEARLLSVLRQTLTGIVGHPIDVRFIVHPRADPFRPPSPQSPGDKSVNAFTVSETTKDSADALFERVLIQMQQRVSRNIWETWIRDLRLVDHINGVLTLGAQNVYAAQWLNDNLARDFEEVFIQSTGSNATIRFIEDQDDAREIQRKPRPKKSRPSRESAVAHEDGNILSIQLLFRRLWNQIVQPHRIVALDRYFIQYWLPLLGPNAASMVLAIRQVSFLHQQDAADVIQATAPEIASWMGVNKGTFWRRLKAAPLLLTWFMQKIEDRSSWVIDEKTGDVGRKPNKYRVWGDIPLTPAHQAAVEAWLKSNNVEKGLPMAIHALKLARDVDIEQILDHDAQPPSGHVPQEKPRAIWQIVRDLVGGFPEHTKKVEEVILLSDELENRIVQPENKVIFTWYFIRDWQRSLGSGPWWLVALLRSRGYYSQISGELRDLVLMEGGVDEIAHCLGVTSESVFIWMGKGHRRNRRTQQSQLLSFFLGEVDSSKVYENSIAEKPKNRRYRKISSRPLAFKIKLLDPLLPEDEILFSEGLGRSGFNTDFLLNHLKHPETEPQVSEIGKIATKLVAESWENRDEIKVKILENRNEIKPRPREDRDEIGAPNREKRDGLKDSLLSTFHDNLSKSRDEGGGLINQMLLPFLYEAIESDQQDPGG
jgi:hypothetical protein